MHAVRAQALRLGRYRTRTLMREAGLRATWKRKFVSTTDSKHALPVAENVLDRQFDVAEPNRAWVSDMTYVRTAQGWLYLAVVLDLYSRKVVGWSMAPTMPADLVMSALTMALQQRQPAPGLVLHSDRGNQDGFNPSSQHLIIEQILDSRPGLRQVSSNQAFFGAWYSVHWQRPGSLERSNGIGLCLLESIVAEDRSCSRSCRAAMDCADRRRIPLPRTRR